MATSFTDINGNRYVLSSDSWSYSLDHDTDILTGDVTAYYVIDHANDYKIEVTEKVYNAIEKHLGK